MSAIEALYIFDEHNTPLLEHTYTHRPPPAHILLPLYLSHPSPRPSLIYLPSTSPPILLYSIIQDRLLFLSPSSTDTEPLQTLEFLHRVADALEDFLGAPLLASKIESNYHVVGELLSEMVDGGVISCTEPNALRDLVEAPSFMKSILGGVGLPSTTPSSLNPGNPANAFSLSSRPAPSPARPTQNPASQNSTSSVPWRRANVRHTSNELYVDLIETLHITLSPSGIPISALAHGSILFTAKVSGIPDLLLQLSAPGGISNTLALPVFHPCVRLNRWKDRPGDLSFVPPDGRFVLAGYEVDLLGEGGLDAFSTSNTKSASKLNVPATATVAHGLGSRGTDFEIRLTANPRFMGKTPSPLPSSTGSSFPSRSGLGVGRGGISLGGSSSGPGTSTAPSVEFITVHVAFPAGVRNIADLRVVKGPGDVGFERGSRMVEWRINAREVQSLMGRDRGGGIGATATVRGTVVGMDEDTSGAEGGALDPDSTRERNAYDYTDADSPPSASYQSPAPTPTAEHPNNLTLDQRNQKLVRRNKALMPSAATVSFQIKGWLASGIRVESLSIDQKKSKGLGAGVQPYKGVKYLCVSDRGVEGRC
ncbi:Adaptor complexes medium subunit family-domain-containing protein [Clohesyomyces aquaticus]|uniref:Adaptor complexes medium subunit family-domain-containing protein n=1 Tax=Clohesyomyces aquaticus TaxID=1231657 RepID=A0A1Y1ZIL6_9PLEO|nr:Adaptor complexes medium subunit family-domain-containing protein [Clohesyomyces aquaticus]